MKVASTLTNIPSDDTGLPSLLSPKAELLSSTDGGTPLSVEDSSPNQSLTQFDEVLAMFGFALSLPMPAPDAPVLIGVPTDSTPIPSAAMELVGQGPLTPSMPPTAEPVPTSTKSIAPDFLLSPGQPLSQPVDPLAEHATRVTERPNFAEPAPQDSIEWLRTPIKVSTTNPIEGPSSPIDRGMFPSTTTDTHSDGTHTETPSIIASRDVSESDLQSQASVHSPATLETSGLSSEAAKTFEFPSLSRRICESRHDAFEPKADRGRPVAHDRMPSELVSPMLPVGDAAEHSATRLDSTVLTHSVAAAMQTHRDELAANQPIELRLRLDPPELGIVRVHLRLTDEAVSVRFITGDEAVTRMLESQLPDLRQSLAERGLAFAQCDVMCDRQQQQSSGFGFDHNMETPIVAPLRSAPRVWSQSSSFSRENISLNNRIDIWA